ncbi:MAG: divalent-cation tolerance protein CutA [Thiobacillaceae bacterium]
MSFVCILTTLPDPATARQLARRLVEARLAACVNVLEGCTSVYRWQGAVEEASETVLVIKTAHDRYAALETFLRQQHPYELPEIIALPIAQGLPEYLDWVRAQTRA